MVSGEFIEVTCNHEDLGTTVFIPKSGESGKVNLGGYTSEDDDKSIAANGEIIDKMTRERAGFEIPCTWDMNDRQDLEKASALQDSPKLGDWTITHINGTVYSGKGKPVGKLEGDAMTGVFTLKVACSNTLKQI